MNFKPLTRGDSKNYKFRMYNRTTKAYVDLTGGTLFFTVKKNADDDDTDALISKAVVCSGTEAVIALLPADTDLPAKVYDADVQFVSADTLTVLTGAGKLQIIRDVTRRITA